MSAPKAKPVIIVEDDPSMSQALERILRIGGYASIVYASAEAFLASDGVATASCLIIDVRLPKLNGFELHRRIAQSGAVLPAIFITAFDEGDARAKARDAGAFAFLAKPFSGRTLLKTVASALGSATSDYPS